MVAGRTLQLRAEPLPAQSDLTSTPFAVLLGRSRATRATGVLSLAAEKFVFLHRGTPIHVDSLLADETSEVWLRTRIPPAADEGAFSTARDAARDTGRGVGESLLGLGLIDPSELFEHKRAHAQAKLISCFAARTGSARFEPRDGFGAEVVPIPLDIVEALREGIGRHYDRPRLDRELPVDDLCRVTALATSAPAGLATEEARILQLAAARPTIQSLVTTGSLRPDAVRRRLYLLYCLGLVAFELGAPIAEETAAERRSAHPLPIPRPSTGTGTPKPPVPPAPPAAATPAPGRPSTPAMPRPSSAPPGPRTSAPPLPRPSSAPSLPRPSSAPAMPRPSAPPGRISTPHPSAPPSKIPSPLGTPVPRRDPRRDPTGPIRTAKASAPVEQALEAAEIARAGDDLLEALEILRFADEQNPGDPRLLAQLAMTLILVDERKNAKEANRLAHEARKAAPGLPLPYVVMGVLLEQIQQREQAAQMYRHALARDSDCAEASKRLMMIEGFKPRK